MINEKSQCSIPKAYLEKKYLTKLYLFSNKLIFVNFLKKNPKILKFIVSFLHKSTTLTHALISWPNVSFCFVWFVFIWTFSSGLLCFSTLLSKLYASASIKESLYVLLHFFFEKQVYYAFFPLAVYFFLIFFNMVLIANDSIRCTLLEKYGEDFLKNVLYNAADTLLVKAAKSMPEAAKATFYGFAILELANQGIGILNKYYRNTKFVFPHNEKEIGVAFKEGREPLLIPPYTNPSLLKTTQVALDFASRIAGIKLNTKLEQASAAMRDFKKPTDESAAVIGPGLESGEIWKNIKTQSENLSPTVSKNNFSTGINTDNIIP